MTIKLYDEDQYLKEFDAKVTGIQGEYVELEQTLFYPESGGQSGDTGSLDREKVAYTKLEGEKHVHIMEARPSFKEGEMIHGVIDWDRRYRIMKLHSASHVMEYFLWQHFGYMERTGSHVDESKDRADYLHEGRLDPTKLRKTEEDTNRFLAEDYPVITTVSSEGVRNWRCGPVGMPCAGTHVKSTGEIGVIRLVRKNPGKGVERIETRLRE